MTAPITHRIIFVNRFMGLKIRFVSTSCEHDHAHISGELIYRFGSIGTMINVIPETDC